MSCSIVDNKMVLLFIFLWDFFFERLFFWGD